MVFRRHPHPDIRTWDAHAAEASILAQIAYMGGGLGYPFDTGLFDQKIGRTPHQPILDANGLRWLAAKLAKLHITTVSPYALKRYTTLVGMGGILRQWGYDEERIAAYLASPAYQQRQRYTLDLISAGRQLGVNRYQPFACINVTDKARRHLANGAAVATADLREGSQLLIIPNGMRGLVKLYAPKYGVSVVSLTELYQDGRINPDAHGCTIYELH